MSKERVCKHSRHRMRGCLRLNSSASHREARLLSTPSLGSVLPPILETHQFFFFFFFVNGHTCSIRMFPSQGLNLSQLHAAAVMMSDPLTQWLGWGFNPCSAATQATPNPQWELQDTSLFNIQLNSRPGWTCPGAHTWWS